MNDDLHNIDDLFKRALEEHTELPSAAVWDNIDKSLDKSKVVSISKKYNKLKWAAAALLLFSIGMALYTIHIRIKNKELVKQHNAGGNLENPKTGTKNTTQDTNSLVKGNSTGIEKTKVGKELKKQENNPNAAATGSNRSSLAEGANTADNLNPGNKLMRPNPGKTHEHISKPDQKQLLLKNKSPIAIQEKPGGIDSSNSEKEVIAINKELEGKADENFVSTKEKNIAGIPVIFSLKSRLQMLAAKPVSPGAAIPTNNVVALKEDKVPVKNYKTGSIQQFNMKNSAGSFLSTTIFFSPDLVSTNVKNDHPLFREEDSHEIEKDEKIKSSYTMGILIDYNTGKNWKLESGITFSTRFTDIEPKTIYARPDNNGNINYRFNCSAGYSYVTLKSSGLPPVYGDSINALTSENILQYIGVPLVVKYLFGKGRFSITPGVGIAVNFLTKGKIETTIPTTAGNEKVTSNDIQGLKSTYFNGLASVGIQYKLNKTFELTFIPTARLALSSINKDAPVKTYLNSIGFAAGIIVKL
jgi:hypothetical protein